MSVSFALYNFASVIKKMPVPHPGYDSTGIGTGEAQTNGRKGPLGRPEGEYEGGEELHDSIPRE